MLTILRVRGASCRDIDDLGEGTLHSLCLGVFLVDLHFPRGDSGRYNELGGYNHMRSHVISFRLSLVLLLSCFVLLTACGQSALPTTGAKPTPTPTVALDFDGTPIVFPTTAPRRIVSLLPSTSEMLGALQLQGRVVAVDYYTSYPPELASLPKVSDVNGKYNVEQIVALKTAPRVLLEVDDSTPGKPYVFGGGSFGDELLQDANGVNIFHNNSSNGGYPQVTDEAIIATNPQFVILTEDPVYGGNPTLVYKRPNWSSIEALQLRQVYHLNVNIIQHPSQRLVDGLRCLAQLIHPARFSGALPAYCSGTA